MPRIWKRPYQGAQPPGSGSGRLHRPKTANIQLLMYRDVIIGRMGIMRIVKLVDPWRGESAWKAGDAYIY